MEKEIKKANPDYSAERVDETIGHIWYHLLTDKKRKSVRRRDG